MTIEELANFLKTANKNTWASETGKKVPAQRPGSKDYEYAEGEWVDHDTYFGGRYFIGEEIVYEGGKPIWGMNYNGYVVDESITEEEIDKSLRAALKQNYSDMVPIRGPKNFKVESYEYKNNVTGELDRFEGREEVLKGGVLIYYGVFHGGLIR